MTRPLFSVGEEVILVSVSHPEFNGEYIVEKVLYPDEIFTCRKSGYLVSNSSDDYIASYGYLLNEIMIVVGENMETCWNQSALRKKYRPSEFTFDELINNLKLETVE